MQKVALVVRIVAKAGKEEEVRAFLAGAEPVARAESFTPVWFVDAFADDAARDRHLAGDIARALMAKASELLAEPPSIEKAEVLASVVRG